MNMKSLKELDWKKLALEKGERVALGGAVVLMVLLIIINLFIPPNGLFSGSPTEKAESLQGATASVQEKLRNRQPTPADLPGDPRDKLIALETRPVTLDPYRVVTFFAPQGTENPNRRPPELLTIDGAAAEVARLNVKTYQLIQNEDGQYTQIVVLDTGAGTGGNRGPGGMGSYARLQTMGRMSPGGRGMGAVPGMGMPGGQQGLANFGRAAAMVQAFEETERKEYQTKTVPIAELEKLQGYEPAVQPRPVRLAIIAASFPYKAQLEEFKNKLHLDSINAVLDETVKGKDGKDELEAFRFIGVNVQRRELDSLGEPVTKWQAIDPARAYIPWLMLSGQELEEEDPSYLPIKFPGLVMERLREFRSDEVIASSTAGSGPAAMAPPGARPGVGPAGRDGGEQPRKRSVSRYPNVVRKVPNLVKTLRALREEDVKTIAAPRSRFSSQSALDPWRPPQATDERANTATPANRPAGTDQSAPEPIVPEHCLVRVVDVTIEPGKTYQYRLQVRMANPNYRRKDVASQSYAENEELPIDDRKWYEVPERVSVPPEMIHYSVDQKDFRESDNKPYRGPNWRDYVHADREVVLQIHRWIEATYLGREKLPTFIGEWAIADRVIVARGEQVGRRVQVELPVWKYNYKDYTIASEPGFRKKAGISVNFGYERPDGAEAVLVDFEGGRQSYTPTPAAGKEDDGNSRAPGRTVSDESGYEVLIMTPDGKLIARHSANDRDDQERIKRRDELRERIDAVKNKGSSGGAEKTGTGGVFGK